MARITKLELISDIELRVNQGTVSDDSTLDHRQIAQWLSEELNGLMVQECEQAKKQGGQIPPLYITRETSKVLVEESIADIDEENERMYFSLTGRVLEMKDDNGMVIVTDQDNNEIFKGSAFTMPMLRNMRYTKPSSSLLTYYRQGENVFVEGFQTSDIDLNTIVVYYVKYQDIAALADTDFVNVTDLMLPVVKDRVTEIAMRQMYGTTPDTANDGTDFKQPAYHRTIQTAPINGTGQQ